MKRIIASILALATVAGAATAASADPWDHDRGRGHGYERGYDRGEHRGYNYGERRGYDRGYNAGYRYGERHEWRRGGYWPRGYGYVVNDPWRYRAYRAPYGYRWVRDDYGQLVLVAIASGLIADVIYNGGY